MTTLAYPVGGAGVAVDGSGNVYASNNGTIVEIPYAFVGPANLTEPASAGADSLLPVLPSTASLVGVFAPTSDQNWLTIGLIASGAINFSFSANTSTSRMAHVTILGQQITVTQDGSAPQTITFWAIPNQPLDIAPFTISAPVSSNLPVSFASQTTSVCTVSGSQVTLVAIGTCIIQATQAGDNNYAAATPANQSFQVLASLCDLKQNGKINVADVQAIINEALGSHQPVNDLNGDGVVNVLDVQIEINAAMGLYCTAAY